MSGLLSQDATQKSALEAALRSRGSWQAETISLLLIGADPHGSGIEELLRKHDRVNFQIGSAPTAEDSLQLLTAGRFDVVLLDDSLPSERRLDLVERLAADVDMPPVILLSGSEDQAVADRAMDYGAYASVRKDSTDYLTLGATVHQALLRYHREDEERRLGHELDRLTVTDGLTGLHNKRYFCESLDKECRRAIRYGTSMSCLLIGLDDFALSSETPRRSSGERLVTEVAALFSRSVRDVDLLARYGKEEFALLLPETVYDGAMLLAERLRFEVAARRLLVVEGEEPITVSAGVFSPAGKDHLRPDYICERLEAALQEAKDGGKNRVCGYADAAADLPP